VFVDGNRGRVHLESPWIGDGGDSWNQ
jgi:hypothetical protein